MNKETKLLYDSIESKITLQDAGEFIYSSIALCMIDAIFSIGVTYKSVENAVDSFCKFTKLAEYRLPVSNQQMPTDEYCTDDLIKLYEKHDCDFETIANTVYKNRCRTSSKNGILKAEAVYEMAKVLKKHGVQKKSDVVKKQGEDAFENDIKAIKGQRSGIMLSYFYMLTGDADRIKPDRHILNFIKESIGRNVDLEEAQKYIEDYVKLKRESVPHINCGIVDYAIWKYMSDRR